ncbi:hypothetical protein [Streptomonospora salina]|uniref:Uncharacterized protein n=1 Tax=Streptomonospora salina TaxID=104205 RepID=A0A841E5U8_9ACTN|nr:hypothetical protein [Streptomonospora salina]MBB5998386.1 hypothetical protein [Streptomonospora salina]
MKWLRNGFIVLLMASGVYLLAGDMYSYAGGAEVVFTDVGAGLGVLAGGIMISNSYLRYAGNRRVRAAWMAGAVIMIAVGVIFFAFVSLRFESVDLEGEYLDGAVGLAAGVISPIMAGVVVGMNSRVRHSPRSSPTPT